MTGRSSPIIGFLTSIVAIYLLLEFGSGVGVPSEIVPPATVAVFRAYQTFEPKLIYILNQLLLSTSGLGVNLVLVYLSWLIGGLSAGLTSKKLNLGVINGFMAVIVGAVLTWIYSWYILHFPTFEILVSSESIGRLTLILSSVLIIGVVSAIGGAIGGAITRKRELSMSEKSPN